MNEPTFSEIADWLRTYAELFDDCTNLETPGDGMRKLATQVEAMGERICLTCEEWLGGIHPIFGCSYDGLIHCKKLNIPGQGCNFGCIHWKRKDG